MTKTDRPKKQLNSTTSARRCSLASGDLFFNHFARDHDFRRLDDRHRIVTASQPQFLNSIARDDRGQRLIADAQSHLRHEPVDAHFVDKSTQPVPAAEGDDDPGGTATGWLRCCGGGMTGEEALDLGVGDAVVSTFGLRCADVTFMNPLFQGRIPNAKTIRGSAGGEQGHVTIVVQIDIARCCQAMTRRQECVLMTIQIA